MTKTPKCLVIDTDIASSAGGVGTQNIRSKSCREFLIAVTDTNHKIVTTETIRLEWHGHQSRFTKGWLVSMVAQRRVCWIDAPADDELRDRLEKVDQDEREVMLRKLERFQELHKADQDQHEEMLGKIQYVEDELVKGQKKRDVMLKDVHLIEAALKADKIVISMDETVRRCFHEATQKIGTLKQIAWVNPCKSEEMPIQWLQDGAELERERLLGYSRGNGES